MKILLIDTCGATGSVAIADTGCAPVRIMSATLPGRSASEQLVARVRELAAECGGLSALHAIAVVNGPGSFTGVRVGLAAAKGLCEALGVPLLAISRLAVLAAIAEKPLGGRVWAVLDAGRGEFYCGEYGEYIESGRVREALLSEEELAALAGESAEVLACEPAVAERLARLGARLVAEPDAAAALSVALPRIQGGEFDDVAAADANYLRRTDLEIFAKVKARASAI
jgi:tRNA threonylcarbamoyladenosine biosynthesis protein TsaB